MPTNLPKGGQKDPPPSSSQLSRAVDFARIFGAAAVFYYHLGVVGGYRFSRWGEYAVALFIFLSGMAYTQFSSLRPTDWSSYWRYVAARAAALWPVYLAVNIAVYAASHFYYSALGRPFTFLEFFLSAAGLSQYFDYRYLSAVMWFVPFILQAYFLFPAIDSVLQRISGVLVVAIAFAISLPLIGFVFSFWPERAGDICRNWSVIFRLPEVCVGIILGRSLRSAGGWRSERHALALFVVISCLLAVAAPSFGMSQSPSYILALPWHGILVSGAIALLAWLAISLFRSANSRWLRILGLASFPFYLGHGIAILFIYKRFGDRFLPWAVYFLLCWCGAIAFTFALRYLQRQMKRRREQVAAE